MSESDLIHAKVGDLSYSLCVSAYQANAFFPEERAEQERNSYVVHMQAVANAFELFKTPDNEAAMREDLERYRQGYLTKLRDKLSADSRTMSSMITGPSNFPVRSNRKKLDIAHRRLNELIEYDKKIIDKLRAKYDPARIASAPIRSDDEDAVTKLQAKLAEHEQYQELMKSVNKAYRRKISDDEKVAAVVALGLSEKVARGLLEPDWSCKQGFPSYELTNNNATIRRLKKRLAQLEAQAEEDDREYEINGVMVVEDTTDRRIRLCFEGKPSPEYRRLLKGHGFKWSQRNKAWQRLLNNSARNAAKMACDAFDGSYE